MTFLVLDRPGSTTRPLPMEPSTKTAQFFGRIKIPTYPDFDLERDSGALDYVPPVQLNNRVVLYTNALIELAEDVVGLTRRIEQLKIDRRKVERLRDATRRRLLAQHPCPPSASKNLQLTDAYVETIAKHEHELDALNAWDNQIADFDDKIDTCESELRNCKHLQETLKLACDNIRTHLSFVKQEARLHGIAPVA